MRAEPAAEAIAYFVFMEAIVNAQKYADASTISVRASASLSEIRLEVRDDGRGGAVEQPGGGISGLRDRVEDARGTFSLDSRRGHGTRIVAHIPTGSRLV
jgi:signal transduction histidine kinase